MFILLAFCTVSLSAMAAPTTVHGTILSKSSVGDSTKKMTAKEWKDVEKQLKAAMPKQMATPLLKQLKEAEKLGKSTSPGDQKALSNMIMKSLNDNGDLMNYEIEKKSIIDDFKMQEFDNAADKREARKDMRRELKELKRDFKRDQKERKKEKKAENLHFI